MRWLTSLSASISRYQNWQKKKVEYSTSLRIMGSQNWWFGDPRPLLCTSKPLYRRVQWFLPIVHFNPLQHFLKSLVPYHWKYLFCRSKLDKLVLVFIFPWANSLLDPMILVCFWVMNCPLALLPEWLDGIRGTIFWERGKFSFGQKKCLGNPTQGRVSMNTCIFWGVYVSCSYFRCLQMFKKNLFKGSDTLRGTWHFLTHHPQPKKNGEKKNITLPAKRKPRGLDSRRFNSQLSTWGFWMMVWEDLSNWFLMASPGTVKRIDFPGGLGGVWRVKYIVR